MTTDSIYNNQRRLADEQTRAISATSARHQTTDLQRRNENLNLSTEEILKEIDVLQETIAALKKERLSGEAAQKVLKNLADIKFNEQVIGELLAINAQLKKAMLFMDSGNYSHVLAPTEVDVDKHVKKIKSHFMKRKI